MRHFVVWQWQTNQVEAINFAYDDITVIIKVEFVTQRIFIHNVQWRIL